jgi:hypothetical protein
MNDSDKNNGFKTPEGYFENFVDKLMGKLLEEQSVLPKQSGFAVPDAYFDTLNSKIHDQLKREGKVVRLNSFKKYYRIAASVAVVLLLFFGLTENRTEEMDFSSLAHSEIENYFDTNEIGLYIDEITEVLPLDELEISDIVNTQMNDENVVDYLDENTDDFEELNLEDYE